MTALKPATGYEGNLNEQQSKSLLEVKKKLSETEYWEDYQRDPDKERLLLAFLRATMKDKSGDRIFQVDACIQRLIATFEWRRQYGVEEIRRNIETGGPRPEKNDTFRQLYITLDVVNESTGQLVRFNRFGQFIANLDASVLTQEEWIRNFAHDSMTMQQKLRQLSVKHGREISTYVVVSDMEGLSLKGIAQRMSFIKFMSGIAGDNFPETLGHTLICRTPWIIPAVTSLVKPFIDPNTFSKFAMSVSIPTEAIKTYLPEDLIPKEYGGRSSSTVPFPNHEKAFTLAKSYRGSKSASPESEQPENVKPVKDM